MSSKIDGKQDAVEHLAAEAAREFPIAAEQQYPLPPSTIAAARYTDPESFEREMRETFYRGWFPACPSVDLPQPRDYVVWDPLRQSVVIARQDDGSVAAVSAEDARVPNDWGSVAHSLGARD